MKKFKQVYFRIHTPSYYNNKYGIGFGTPEESQNFHNNIKELFINNGWNIKKENFNGGCATVIKDKQELYLHPQSISGVVTIENITYIEQLLSTSTLFTFRNTDIYEDVFDITDEEYIDMLQSKRKEIEYEILKVYRTKRSNLYITTTWDTLQSVLEKFRIKRISHYIGVYSLSNVDFQYISEIFENLVNSKRIITAQCQSGTGYRTVDYKDTKIIYKNEGEELETICNYKSLKNILKKLQGCSWITDITVVDNII